MNPSCGRPTLSIVIPVYNERATIGRVLLLVLDVLPDTTKEVVLVDDGSTDGTREWLCENVSGDRWYRCVRLREDGTLAAVPADAGTTGAACFKVHFHERNQGKGGALRTGLAAATGEVLVIQDADLEYDPGDWERMLPLITERKVADVVYGSRFHGHPHRALYFHHYIGNRIISLAFNALYNQTLSDIEVCYKMFTREVLQSLKLTARDFGIEVQVSAQIARARKWRIYELGIHYFGRTYQEGKKISWKDGVKALWYLVKFRFARG